MAIVQWVKRLDAAPPSKAAVPDKIQFCPYGGPTEIRPWLELQQLAFAELARRPKPWQTGDFQREFTDQPWWRPECLWFAWHTPAPTESTAALPLGFQANPNGRLAASSGSMLAGSISWHLLTQCRQTATLGWLAVHPRYRRQGIAGRLVALVEELARANGCQELRLQTSSAWQAACALYAALGFVAENAPCDRPETSRPGSFDLGLGDSRLLE